MRLLLRTMGTKDEGSCTGKIIGRFCEPTTVCEHPSSSSFFSLIWKHFEERLP